MNLCLDIGNSKIRAGVFSQKRLLAEGVIYYERDISALKIRAFIGKFASRYPIDQAGLISVSPPLTARVRKAFKELPDIRFKVINYSDFKIMNIRYRNPGKLGIDRLINVYAAFSIYDGPALVVDIGTAVTWDAVTAKGEYMGGAIAPGPGTMAEALHQYTAALPLVKLKRKPRFVGRDTGECIQAGLYWGTVGMIKELIGGISRDTKRNPRVIFTGGLGTLFAREFRGCLADELLTLKGIDRLLKEMKNQK
ncbi:MAG: type III pantothenate kinase [Candidatus Edwardsbacteria bacterium]|nr:type III pantothenate kinase [Candidatus Edwardsbacteria bacterium]MBU1576645.1 type III pantothenate kinase [Candidatus Edwardsbacteria bacterium]MBU2462988.1 type III pantothenate kinase [Candidatus Edwardsbacteria bacterium]MBU2594473.1 type III pantothenate kinase [Candidatus Edwardsbacteria bacterium]